MIIPSKGTPVDWIELDEDILDDDILRETKINFWKQRTFPKLLEDIQQILKYVNDWINNW